MIAFASTLAPHLAGMGYLTIGLLLCTLLVPMHAQGTTTTDGNRTSSATGNGQVTIPATISQISVGVYYQQPCSSSSSCNIQGLSSQVSDTTKAVIQALQTAVPSVTNLQTAGISLQPIYNYNGSSQSLEGYSGSVTITFEVPVNSTAAALQAVIQAGATNINSVIFTADAAAITSAQSQAADLAIQNGKSLATAALTSLNLQPTGVFSVSVSPVTFPNSPVAYKTSTAGTSFPIVAGGVQVTATAVVTLSF